MTIVGYYGICNYGGIEFAINPHDEWLYARFRIMDEKPEKWEHAILRVENGEAWYNISGYVVPADEVMRVNV